MLIKGGSSVALGDCRPPSLVTIVSHVTDGAITMCSVELCRNVDLRLKCFNACYLVELWRYIGGSGDQNAFYVSLWLMELF